MPAGRRVRVSRCLSIQLCDSQNDDRHSREKESQVDLSIRILEGVLQAAQSSLADLREEQNWVAPIGKLCDENLLAVIEELCCEYRTDEHYKHLRTLRLISRRWARVILASPTLWTQISANHPPQTIELALMTSRNAPLYIRAYKAGYSVSAKSGWKESLVDKILHQAYRWKSLGIKIESGDRQYTSFLGAPAADLKSLSIQDKRGGYNTSPDEVDASFNGTSPTLQRMTCVGASFPKGVNLTGLNVLTLREVSMTAAQVCDVLSSTPLLTRLTLRTRNSASTTSFMTQDGGSSRPILLQLLKHLTICDPAARPVLSRLHAPALESLSITDQATQIISSDYWIPWAEQLTKLWPTRDLDLQVGGSYGPQFRFQGRFSLSIHTPHRSRDYENLTRFYTPIAKKIFLAFSTQVRDTITRLKWGSGPVDASPQVFPIISQLFPHIDTIQFRTEDYPLPDALIASSDEEDSDAEETAPIFPNFQTLKITSNIPEGWLEDVLEARAGRSFSVEILEKSGNEVRLSELISRFPEVTWTRREDNPGVSLPLLPRRSSYTC